MLNLPVLQPAEIDSPAQMFRCEFYKATLAAGICIARQGEPHIRGGAQEWMKRPRYEYCAGGECEQGNTIKERLGDAPVVESKKDRARRERTVAGKATVAEIEKRLAEKPPAEVDVEPASPAEEKTVAEAIEEEKGQACIDCGKDVRRGRDGKTPERCFKCRLKAGEVSGRKGKQPRAEKKTPTLREVAKRYNGKTPLVVDAPYRGPVKPDDDVLILLQQKRQHHVDQVARIDKALEALG